MRCASPRKRSSARARPVRARALRGAGAAAVPIALRYGDHDITSDYLATLRATASAHGFDIWRNHAECLTGQFDIRAGHPGAGLARLGTALRRVEASGFRRLLAR